MCVGSHTVYMYSTVNNIIIHGITLVNKIYMTKPLKMIVEIMQILLGIANILQTFTFKRVNTIDLITILSLIFINNDVAFSIK